MNTIPFTTSQSEAIRYLAHVAATHERTDARPPAHHTHPYIPARRRRQSRKSARVAGPPGVSPGVPAEIKELVEQVLAAQQQAKSRAEQGSVSPIQTEFLSASSPLPSPKPSLKLVPWTYPPIDEDAITPPSPILMEASRALAPFLNDGFASDALSVYDSSEFDSELETETDDTEIETEVEESDAGPSIHRPRIHVVDDSEPPTPEFDAELFKKWPPMEPLVIPEKTSSSELTPIAAPVVEIESPSDSESKSTIEPSGLGKLVDPTWIEDEEDGEEDEDWTTGVPNYYTSPPESPRVSPGITPAGSPCSTPAFSDCEYESDPDSPFDPETDPVVTHHLRTDLEIIRPFSPLAPEINFTPPTWAAASVCIPQQDEAYGQLLALPGTTPLGPAELEHNTLVTRARIRRNPATGSQECMWRGKWAPCCWACGGAAEGMDTSLPASQRTGWFVLDNQRWLMVRG